MISGSRFRIYTKRKTKLIDTIDTTYIFKNKR